MPDDALTAVPLRGGGAIPILGFGTWQITGRRACRRIDRPLRSAIAISTPRPSIATKRDPARRCAIAGCGCEEVFVTTKLPPEPAGRERATLEASLRDLGTDHVDLWLIHWPPAEGVGLASWRAMLQLSEEGVATAVGVSNYRLSQVDELTKATGVAPQ